MTQEFCLIKDEPIDNDLENSYASGNQSNHQVGGLHKDLNARSSESSAGYCVDALFGDSGNASNGSHTSNESASGQERNRSVSSATPVKMECAPDQPFAPIASMVC